MKEFLLHVKAIPVIVMKAINGFLTAIGTQISTAKGAIILIIVLITLADIFLGMGSISRAVKEGEGVLKAFFGVIKEVGVATLAILLIAFAIHKSKP